MLQLEDETFDLVSGVVYRIYEETENLFGVYTDAKTILPQQRIFIFSSHQRVDKVMYSVMRLSISSAATLSLPEYIFRMSSQCY